MEIRFEDGFEVDFDRGRIVTYVIIDGHSAMCLITREAVMAQLNGRGPKTMKEDYIAARLDIHKVLEKRIRSHKCREGQFIDILTYYPTGVEVKEGTPAKISMTF